LQPVLGFAGSGLAALAVATGSEVLLPRPGFIIVDRLRLFSVVKFHGNLRFDFSRGCCWFCVDVVLGWS